MTDKEQNPRPITAEAKANKPIFIKELNRIVNDKKMMKKIKKEFMTENGKKYLSSTFEKEFIDKFDIEHDAKIRSSVAKFEKIWFEVVPAFKGQYEEIEKVGAEMKKFIDNNLYFQIKGEKDRRNTIKMMYGRMRRTLIDQFKTPKPEGKEETKREKKEREESEEYKHFTNFQFTKETTAVNKERFNKLRQKNKDPKKIEIKYSKVKKVIRDLINATGPDKHQKYLEALLLSSGCRIIELLDSGTTDFEEAGPNSIKLIGTAKKQSGEKIEIDIPRPLIELTSDEFLKALKVVRKKVKLVDVEDRRKQRAETTQDPEFNDVHTDLNTLFKEMREEKDSQIPIARQIYAAFLHNILFPHAPDRGLLVGEYFAHETGVSNYLAVKLTDDEKELKEAKEKEELKRKLEECEEKKKEYLDKLKRCEEDEGHIRRNRIPENENQKYERFKKTMKIMEEKKEKPTNQNIKKYAFGSDSIKELRDKYEAEKKALINRLKRKETKEIKRNAKSNIKYTPAFARGISATGEEATDEPSAEPLSETNRKLRNK